MADSSPRVWFITGASRGLGRAVAEAALARGDRVAATARDPGTLADLVAAAPERAVALRLDVTAPGEAQVAVDAALAAFGRLDVVVNNAGFGLLGALEELTEEQMRRQWETNFLGAVHVVRASLPVLRGQRSGHLVFISAAAAISNYPGFSLYGASKAALEADVRGQYGLAKQVVAVEGCRGIGKRDMRLNDATPTIEVHPETYEVRADGVLLTCEPARELPLAQRYFLF
jgi:NAD(P)-dependent dehydrogenase (short-subunit alcohol dehydrogenase family)